MRNKEHTIITKFMRRNSNRNKIYKCSIIKSYRILLNIIKCCTVSFTLNWILKVLFTFICRKTILAEQNIICKFKKNNNERKGNGKCIRHGIFDSNKEM